jgi:mycothiol synthase
MTQTKTNPAPTAQTAEPATTAPGAEVALPDAPPVPGLRFRRLRDETDWAGQAEVWAASSQADGDDFAPSGENLRIEAENRAGFLIERDLLLADVDGRIVGLADGQVHVRDGRPVHHLTGLVHPEFRRRGIGGAMLAWNERRARELAAADATLGGPGAQLGSWVGQGEVGAIALLEREGYEVNRYGFTMIRRGLDDVERVALPDGLQLRPVLPEHHRMIWAADNEAFRDHWEHREQTDEDFAALFGQPELDTSLWRVAWAGDEVAGSVQSWIWTDENATLGLTRGWLERISVRRQWRRRGLAGALIASALIGLRERGMTEAMLGVDAENESGALSVYKSAGFQVKLRSSSYRKALGV